MSSAAIDSVHIFLGLLKYLQDAEARQVPPSEVRMLARGLASGQVLFGGI